jgi:hypothetical protein
MKDIVTTSDIYYTKQRVLSIDINGKDYPVYLTQITCWVTRDVRNSTLNVTIAPKGKRLFAEISIERFPPFDVAKIVTGTKKSTTGDFIIVHPPNEHKLVGMKIYDGTNLVFTRPRDL